MKFEELETPRLILRKATPETLTYVHSHYGPSALGAFFGHETEEDVEMEKSRYAQGFRTFNRSFLYFHLLDKDSRQVLGWCGFHTWYLEHFRAEIGYVLTREDRRSEGLMTEAMGPVLEYGFDAMRLNRVEAYVGEDNVASLKILDRFGFTQEGRLKEHYFTNGKCEDSLLFALLKRQFMTR